MPLQHAFLMEVHKSPELFSRIVKILAADNHHFYVHIDAKVAEMDLFVNAVKDIKNVTFIDRIKIFHGAVSQIYCEIALFKAAYANPHIDYFHLISGQDYPLRSNTVFDDFFEKHCGESFTCIEGQSFHDEMMKHKYRMRTELYCPNEDQKWFRLFLRLTWRMQLMFHTRRPIPGCWGGWNWKSLHRSVTGHFLDYLEHNPKFLKRFNHTMCCDEIYFATIYKSKMKEMNIKGLMPLRFVSTEPKWHIEETHRPYTMDERDYPDIYPSQAFFCRKVDLPYSSKLLDMIDRSRDEDFDMNCAAPVLKLKKYEWE